MLLANRSLLNINWRNSVWHRRADEIFWACVPLFSQKTFYEKQGSKEILIEVQKRLQSGCTVDSVQSLPRVAFRLHYGRLGSRGPTAACMPILYFGATANFPYYNSPLHRCSFVMSAQEDICRGWIGKAISLVSSPTNLKLHVHTHSRTEQSFGESEQSKQSPLVLPTVFSSLLVIQIIASGLFFWYKYHALYLRYDSQSTFSLLRARYRRLA